MVSCWTAGWGQLSEGIVGTAPASAAWHTANAGVWWPIYVPTICVVRRFWWANGVTVSASYNVEAGLYLDGGHKPGAKLITTGSVAQGTASNVQFADVTDTTLAPGLYWLFVSCSSTSATFFRSQVSAGAVVYPLVGFTQTSIGPGSAPATATPAELSTGNIYLCGFATTASP
jgi:hypothetical protein